MRRHVVILLLIFSFLPVSSQAEGVLEVVSTGPSWESFTHRDGSGLYHEILREVFALYGVSVRHEYVPTDRGDELVRLGQADIMTCDDRATPPLVPGRYPMYTDDYFVFFNRSRIGLWSGQETLRNKEIVCQMGYYHDWDFLVPVRLKRMPSGAKCLEMILLGRSDFYVDDMSFIKTSIRGAGQGFDREKYDIRRVDTRSYHPLFNRTFRGEKIRHMYEEGIMRLHKAGKLKPIYDKWGHDYPDFDSF